MFRFCDRYALDRSLVLLVSVYTRVGGESVVADELCEAASGCAAVVKSASTINQAYSVYRFCDRFALERSLARLVNCYAVLRVAKFVAAEERSEAAIGCEAVVKPTSTICQSNRVSRFCDRFALERSLVLLVNCYAVV